MKKLSILSLFMAAVTLSGCSLFNLKITELEKQNVNYTYKDYLDHNRFDIDGTPTSGQPKILVIPVWFTDSLTYIPLSKKDKVKKDIKTAYFGSSSEAGWESVHTYYKKLSHDKLLLDGRISDWYECGHPASYYASEENGQSRTKQLVRDAVTWYKGQVSDLTSFDLDKNGYLDGVMLIYAAPDYGALEDDSASNLWAYCYWLQDHNPNVSDPNPDAFFWASYDFMYGKNDGFTYYSGDTRYCNIDTHTYIHEMGHMFGLEDYYDYSGQYDPAGGFSMQDLNIGSHDPYSALALGWANAYVPTESCNVELKPFQDSGDIIILSPNFQNSPFDEYLILEYYTPTGLNYFDTKHQYQSRYPMGPSYSGIRLWHVDGRLLELDSPDSDKYRIATKIESNKYYTHMLSNTYYKKNKGEDYISPLGKDYANYNILQLIRNNKEEDYQPTSYLDRDDLFYVGDKFTMREFSDQFVQSSRLNNKSSLGWSFSVRKSSAEKITITLTKDY